MLLLKEIEKEYSPELREFERSMLREYLQYKILEIIFNSKYSSKLAFIGGTALRIVYNHTRFSEDLDFDNFGLTYKEFINLSHEIKNNMEILGFETEIVTVSKNAYRCNVKLPGILFANGLSPYEEEKILIQVDTLTQEYSFVPDRKIIKKFDVLSEIFVAPLPLLLSQKIYASINRKKAKGRDFYDIIFLYRFTEPDYEFLKYRLNIDNFISLKEKILEETKDFDLKKLADDLSPLIFDPSAKKKVELFREFIKQKLG